METLKEEGLADLTYFGVRQYIKSNSVFYHNHLKHPFSFHDFLFNQNPILKIKSGCNYRPSAFIYLLCKKVYLMVFL